MKIKPEHYHHMLESIRPIAHKIPAHRESLRNDPRIKDLDKRVRWDAFYASKLSTWLCDNVYSYANDDHVDTALRSIMRELNV